MCAAVIALAAAVCLPAPAQAAPPQITATWVTDVSAGSANLHAEIDAEGLSTTYRFEYLSETAYAANLAAGFEAFAGATRVPVSGGVAGAGSTDQAVVQILQGIPAATAFHYRVVAENATGPSLGPTRRLETEEAAPVFALADHRGWEMVSPVEKNGGAIQGPGKIFGGALLQAAAQGSAVTYSSASSFAGGTGAPAASQYLSAREAEGWSTANLTAPQLSAAEPQPGAGVPYRAFSEDLSSALVFGGGACSGPGEGCADPSPPPAGPGAPPGYQNYYLRDDSTGAYQTLITAADAPELGDLSPEALEVQLAGASPDLGHVVLSTCARLTPEATEQPACGSGGPNLYEWSGGSLRLVNLLGGDTQGTSDAHLASPSGAISSDGSRVYFTDGEEAFLYLREGGAGATLVSAEPGVRFQTASADGSVAFYSKGGELFRFEAPGATTEPIATGVEGVLGASADGSRVYYETASGLFLWEAGAGAAKIAAEADPVDWPPATGEARVSADGRYLAFSSSVEESGFDDTDAATGLPDPELYIYDADSGELSCASCNPTGERPTAPSSLPGALVNGEGEAATELYKPRALAANGRRLFFDSSDSLVLQDTNARPDVYEWEAGGEGTCARPAGCISLISSGRDGEASEFVDASESGGDAFFRTAASLVPSDPGSYDLYDAREGGGFPVAPAPIPCEGDACQPLPSEPEDPTPGTLVPGEPNPPLLFPKEQHKKAHHKKHHRRKGHRKGKAHHKGTAHKNHRHHKAGHHAGGHR